MVEPSPELLQKLFNTARLIISGRPDLAPPPGVTSPTLIDVPTFNGLLANRPWAEPVFVRPVPGAPRAASPVARPGGPPVVGAPVYDRVLVLAVDFPDKPAQTDISIIKDIFFSPTANQGHTFRNYYAEISYGKFTPEGEIHGWYRAPQSSTFYANNNTGIGAYPNNYQKLYEDVLDLAAADPAINWNAIDANGDGLIDQVVIVHSGAEAAATGNLNDLWAVTWNITPKRVAGKTFSVFATTAEYIMAPGDNKNIGVTCHEFGHVLGLPDLYDTTQNSRGAGIWSLMAGGSWANGGFTPVHMDPFSKRALGWSNIILNPTGEIRLNQAETSPDIIAYSTKNPSETFLIENRQKTSFDSFLPGTGLLIWRVNTAQTGNDNPRCYLAGIIEADGANNLARNANAGTASDPFPGSLNVRSIGPDTTPSKLTLCDGSPENLSITNISDSGAVITFTAQFVGAPPPPPATRYRCTSTGCVPDPAGAYDTMRQCESFCVPTPAGQRYNCVGGVCTPDSAGQFDSLTACQAVCTPITPTRYNCVSGVCIQDSAGQFDSLATCQANCPPPPPPSVMGYRCMSTCVQDPAGPFGTLAECQTNCLQPPPPPSAVRYNCFSGFCFQDPNGPFTSLTECLNACGYGSIFGFVPRFGFMGEQNPAPETYNYQQLQSQQYQQLDQFMNSLQQFIDNRWKEIGNTSKRNS